jgi:hypothetical protein
MIRDKPVDKKERKKKGRAPGRSPCTYSGFPSLILGVIGKLYCRIGLVLLFVIFVVAIVSCICSSSLGLGPSNI